jgi:hypothetical protein
LYESIVPIHDKPYQHKQKPKAVLPADFSSTDDWPINSKGEMRQRKRNSRSDECEDGTTLFEEK